VTLLIAVAAFLAAQTPFHHVAVECRLLAVLGFCAAVRVVAST